MPGRRWPAPNAIRAEGDGRGDAPAVTDRHDVVPQAIETAGGQILHVGMPVDPGNLLVLGEIDGKPYGIVYPDGRREALRVVAVNPALQIRPSTF